MPYKMIIHSAGGPTGHFAVEILDVGNENYVKGFYPSRGKEVMSGSTLPVTGEVKDDANRIDEGRRNGSILSSKEIPLSKEEFDRVKGYFDQAEHNPGQYDLNDRNCVDFANGALRAAGVGNDLGNVLSQEQKAQMSGASVYQGRKYPEHDGLKLDMPPKPEKSQPETQPFPVPLPPKPADGQTQPPLTPEPTPEPSPAPETTAPPAPETDPTPAPAPEQKQSEAPSDPQVAAMVEMAGKPVDNPGRAALLKPVENLTQPEMTDMINHALGDYRGHRSGDPLKYHTYEKVQDWHAAMYGDGPQQYDGGKPIEPTPIAADILGHEHGKITYGHYGEPKPSSMHYRRPRSSISARSG